MKKLTLRDWAATAEIVASVAVVISLLILAYNVNQNTAALSAETDQFIFQVLDNRHSDVASNGELATIIYKFQQNEEVTDIEIYRYISHYRRYLNMWELAFDRFSSGLLAAEDWPAWDQGFSNEFRQSFNEEWWAELRFWYGEDFARNVDRVYAEE
jgi:hypothetical protein